MHSQHNNVPFVQSYTKSSDPDAKDVPIIERNCQQISFIRYCYNVCKIGPSFQAYSEIYYLNNKDNLLEMFDINSKHNREVEIDISLDENKNLK